MNEPIDFDKNPPQQPASIERLPERKDVPSARLVVVEQVYHAAGNEACKTHGKSYVRWLPSEEQVYDPQRKVKVGKEWQSVDTGWVKNVGTLVIINHTPKGRFRKESAEDRSGVLEVCLAPMTISEIVDGPGMWAKTKDVQTSLPHLVILPEETARFTPVRGNAISVRCREGEGVYSVFAVEG